MMDSVPILYREGVDNLSIYNRHQTQRSYTRSKHTKIRPILAEPPFNEFLHVQRRCIKGLGRKSSISITRGLCPNLDRPEPRTGDDLNLSFLQIDVLKGPICNWP